MEVRQLRYFVGIVDAGSISRAALALHVAQPALSLQMNHLEARLGVKLLNRSVRGIEPTQAGIAVYRHAQQVLKQLDATEAVAAEADAGPAGPVLVGLPWTVASVIGLPLLRQVLDALPAVRLQIIEGPSSMLASACGEGRIDLAVVFDNTPDQSLVLQPLIEEPLWAVGARGVLKRRRRCSVVEAAAYPLVLLSRPNGIREQLERLWADAGVKPRIIADINSPGLLVKAIAEGIGVSILPSASMTDKIPGAKLDRARLTDDGLVRTAYVGRPRQFAASRAADCVRDLLAQCVTEAVADGRWQGRLLGTLDRAAVQS